MAHRPETKAAVFSSSPPLGGARARSRGLRSETGDSRGGLSEARHISPRSSLTDACPPLTPLDPPRANFGFLISNLESRISNRLRPSHPRSGFSHRTNLLLRRF